MLEVQVAGLALDRNKMTVVLLREPESELVLPIWIGPSEASAIHSKLANQQSQRPLTHDLMHTLLDQVGAVVLRVEINAIVDQIYFATIVLRDADGKESVVDARPSDSIALALRCSAPIFVADDLLKSANVIEGGTPFVQPEPDLPTEKSQEALKQRELRVRLRSIDPSEFGSFRLGG